MDLSELLRKDLIEKFQSDEDQIRNEITNAEKQLRSAEKMLGIEEWGYAHTAAYTAMLHAARALMFRKGYRPKGHEHHVAVVSFAKIYEKRYSTETIESFEQGRRRRHEFTYDDADAISESQAKNMVLNAMDFLAKTREILKF